MFQLPKSTLVNRHIPKSKFYMHLQVDRRLKDLFTRQIEKIVWKHKLAKATIHLNPSGDVEEIQIFEIELKEPNCSQDLLRSIDREIPYPILYVLVYGEQAKFVMAYKERHKSDPHRAVVHAYYETDWRPKEQLELNVLQGFDLRAVYENIIRQLMSGKARVATDFSEAIERQARIDKLTKECKRLEAKIRSERQFQRKVELNMELQHKKKELEQLISD